MRRSQANCQILTIIWSNVEAATKRYSEALLERPTVFEPERNEGDEYQAIHVPRNGQYQRKEAYVLNLNESKHFYSNGERV